MVFYDMQTCGGLEEYAATLAVGLAQAGHQVSAVSTAWIPPDNQYLLRLQAANVKLRTLSAKVLLARAGRGKNV